jgi:hypothetical protein
VADPVPVPYRPSPLVSRVRTCRRCRLNRPGAGPAVKAFRGISASSPARREAMDRLIESLTPVKVDLALRPDLDAESLVDDD